MCRTQDVIDSVAAWRAAQRARIATPSGPEKEAAKDREYRALTRLGHKFDQLEKEFQNREPAKQSG